MLVIRDVVSGFEDDEAEEAADQSTDETVDADVNGFFGRGLHADDSCNS